MSERLTTSAGSPSGNAPRPDRTHSSHRERHRGGERRLEAVVEEATSPEISTSPGDLVGDLEVIGAPRRPRSSAGAFPDARSRRRYWLVFAGLAVLAAASGYGLLAADNPMPAGSRGFWLIAEMRATSLVVMAVVSFCQAIATITFMTVTNNRIITPSIMGFESLYTVIQTSAVYVLGVAGVVALQGLAVRSGLSPRPAALYCRQRTRGSAAPSLRVGGTAGRGGGVRLGEGCGGGPTAAAGGEREVGVRAAKSPRVPTRRPGSAPIPGGCEGPRPGPEFGSPAA